MSDQEYDRVFDRLLTVEKQFPELAAPDSPTRRIGSDLSHDFPEVAHHIPMLSLDKVYTTLEISAWMEKLSTQADHLSLKQILGYLVWLGQLPEPTLRLISSRLRFKSNLKRLLIETSKINQALPDLAGSKPSEIVHAFEKAPRLSLYAAYVVNEAQALREPLWGFVCQWAEVTLHTTGDDLRELGLRPSPAYGRILTTLRDAWLDGKVQSRAEEKALLNKLVSEIE